MKSSAIILAWTVVCGTVCVAHELPCGAETLFDDTVTPRAASMPVVSLDTPSMGPWGFDVSGMNRSVKPGDDFNVYAGGKWAERTQIPADRARYGAFDALRVLSDARVRDLLETIARDVKTLPAEATEADADRVKLAGLFASYLDQAEVDRRDDGPIKPILAGVKQIKDHREMAAWMGRSQGMLAGGGALVSAGVSADEKNPQWNTLYVSQAGLNLPDREYYLDAKYAKQLARYQEYVEQLLTIAGWDEPKTSAENIVAFERQIAEIHWTRAQSRDREKTYNASTIQTLADAAPGLEWQQFFDAAGVGRTAKIVVSQDTAMPKLAKLFAETPIETLRAWQAFMIIDEAAPLLSQRFSDASFEFRGKFLSGTPQQRERAKRAASFVESAMGEAVGREYVAKYFTPDAKAKADELVRDVRAAMKNRIETLDWMSAETKEKAQAKLAKFSVKIAYPDQWRDYSRLIVDPNDLFANAARAQRFSYEYRIAKLGQKVDKTEWGMTPQTVNAYYNGSQNEIVFPAAILQPPFFDASADAAVNYGGIGAVIGHEITHGFDDQGRKSDGDGVLTDWWTKEDAEKFEQQATKLGAQYEDFIFPNVPESKINGRMTMGENIADLGGILVALDAYELHLAGRASPVIDGFTGRQRVFLGWAQVWRSLSRDAALKQQLATDSHSPGPIRAFAPLRNVDAWYEAFDVQPGDKQYVKPEDRVRIW